VGGRLGGGASTFEDEAAWAQREFGGANLGDQRRTARLVSMAAGLAAKPAGRITEVFEKDADRQGAYGFLENEPIVAETIRRSSCLASAKRFPADSFVFVPTDGSSLTLRDPRGLRELGPVGTDQACARGLEVMNAIAVEPDGTPLGLCGQAWWVRRERPRRGRKRQRGGSREARRRAKQRAKRKAKRRVRKPFEEKETRFWVQVVEQVRQARHEAGVRCRLWFQLDRGGDFGEMLANAVDHPEDWFTIRAAQDRRTREAGDAGSLWKAVEGTKPLGRYCLKVPTGRKRKARMAEMEVRACQVTLELRHPSKSRWRLVTLGAVLTRERGTPPPGEELIEWLLLTTHPVNRFADACLVVKGYAQRWRVEQFHKTWKSTCRVETNELRRPERIKKWATISAAVAMRIERLTYLARTAPDLPATTELTQAEVNAIVLLKKPTGYRWGDVPSIATAVRWIADLGGYTGKSSGGPPGAIVIGRGLKRIEPVVIALRNMAELKAQGEM